MSSSIPETMNLNKYIELRDHRPHIRGRRLPVIFVVAAQQANNLSIAELAYQFTLSEEQVLAALLFYREHQEQIDAQDATDTAQSLEMHQRYANKPGRA